MKMKIRNLAILFVCIISLGLSELQAQVRNGNPYYGRGRSTVPQAADPPPEPKYLTAEEIVAKEMPKISEAADLNEFEQAVVTSILTKYTQQRIELAILELEPEKTKETVQKIRKNQNEELKAGLPEEKYNIIMEIQEKGIRKVQNNNKKKKKKKKKES